MLRTHLDTRYIRFWIKRYERNEHKKKKTGWKKRAEIENKSKHKYNKENAHKYMKNCIFQVVTYCC